MAEMGAQARADRAVGMWLLAVCACVVAMILVGGATRLTDSGLSITEWRLDKGLVPPLSAERWAEEFALYQRTVEYQEQNRGMSLAAFQSIYWWEWAHRFLGKLVGLVFAVPFLVLLAMGRLRGRLWPLLGLFALGALQGAIGKWMVDSGLAGRLDVSPVRLAVHLGLAFVILGAALWLALDAFGWPRAASRLGAPRGLAPAFLAALFVQVILGALLAGSDAGRAYADWPTIGGEWVPSGYAGLDLGKNHATQQFNHRIVGYLVAALALALGVFAARRGTGAARAAALGLMVVAATQAGLGIATALAAAPFALSLLHQGGAIALWACAVLMLRAGAKGLGTGGFRPPPREGRGR